MCGLPHQCDRTRRMFITWMMRSTGTPHSPTCTQYCGTKLVGGYASPRVSLLPAVHYSDARSVNEYVIALRGRGHRQGIAMRRSGSCKRRRTVVRTERGGGGADTFRCQLECVQAQRSRGVARKRWEQCRGSQVLCSSSKVQTSRLLAILEATAVSFTARGITERSRWQCRPRAISERLVPLLETSQSLHVLRVGTSSQSLED